jgi:CRP-like cAMP-binding protein
LEERIQLLSLVDIFEPLSEEEIEQLNGQLSDVHLEPNEIFYTPHDRSEKLFVLWKGRVRIYRTTDGGREFTLATVEAGRVFGEMALTAQQMQEAYAQAMEPSELSVMHRADLERLILEKPEVGLQISYLLSERLRRYETRLEDITLKGVTARLASDLCCVWSG